MDWPLDRRKSLGINIPRKKKPPINRVNFLILLIIIIILVSSTSAFLLSDSDDDGLLNYEEIAYGVNPFDGDTSGDSISDGDAVKYGLEPSKRYPEDFVKVFNSLETSSESDLSILATAFYKDDKLSENETLYLKDFYNIARNYPVNGIKLISHSYKDKVINRYDLKQLEVLNGNETIKEPLMGGRLKEKELTYLDILTQNKHNIAFQVIDKDYHEDGKITWQELNGSSDFDQDGLIEAEEYRIGTDPFDQDTDKDGLLDGWEVYGYQRYGFEPVPIHKYGANPLHKDIFIEYMGYEKIKEEWKDEIVEVFRFAPISNQDGGFGINLHFDDDTRNYSLNGNNTPLTNYTTKQVGTEHYRYGVFRFIRVAELEENTYGTGNVPGFNMKINKNVVNHSIVKFVVVHEIGHNILGMLDEHNRLPNDMTHSKHLGYVMRQYVNDSANITYHPWEWFEIERDGLLGLPSERAEARADWPSQLWEEIEWKVIG